ncbi:hypothetical protein C3R44_24335, partial [Mycobacterium tuberculosis]
LAAASRPRGALRLVAALLPAPAAVGPGARAFRPSLRRCPAAPRRALLFAPVGALAAPVLGLPPPAPLAPSAGFF